MTPDQPPSPTRGSAAVDPQPRISAEPRVLARRERPALSWSELGGVVVAGFLLEVSVRGGLDNAASMLAVLTLSVALLSGGRLEQRSARLLVFGAAALAPWLAIRASGGLTAATIAAIAALLALSVGLSQLGTLSNMRARTVGRHVGAQSFEWLFGLAMLQRLLTAELPDRRWRALARGIALGTPVVALFAILLASADDVFASFLLIDGLPSLVGHLLATATVSMLLLGLVSRAAHHTEVDEDRGIGRPLGSTEVTVMLLGIVALFAAFVATQVAVAVGGVDHILETENLTQSEHARRGFFQLLFVAALAMGLLGVLRAIRPGGSAVHGTPLGADGVVATGADRFRPLAIAVLALTLIIVGISIQRLVFYVDAFGLTPLRLWSLVAAMWIGVVLVADVASIAGVAGSRSWFPGFLVVSAAFVVFALNVLNPDAVVVRYNLTAETEGPIDTAKLASLSDDAVPAALDVIDQLEPELRVEFGEQLCTRWDLDASYGLLGANLAERRADARLDEFCESVPAGPPRR